MDPNSTLSFDSHYFTAVDKNQGLFQSDAALLTDPTSAGIVRRFQSRAAFLTQFGKSMVKMGGIQVLVGDAGEIRKNCRVGKS
ncbi:UNVERIFIED_CONTAM: Peroxidase 3 [Sesamum latifolium]|uniref:peroxidase n=1 Tax=Sesamum latifolium TaxID=2727402 RepID=A0AAW2XTT4_9LAMI